jgi:hypothetical protein
MNAAGNASWVTSALTGSNSAFDHITVTNSGTFVAVENSLATAGLTINGLAVTSSTYTQRANSGTGAIGCFDIREYGTTTATFSLSNAYFDCNINLMSLGNLGIWTWRNVMTYRSQSGSYPGHYAGISNGSGVGPADSFDEYYFYGSFSFAGGTDVIRPLTPVFSLINSVLYSPKTSTAGNHVQSLTTNIYYLPPTGNILIKNNVTGATGVNVSNPPQQLTTSFSAAATSLPRAVSMTVTGNVGMCDQWGFSSFAIPFTRWNGQVAQNLTELIENNTNCAAIIGGLTSNNDNAGQEGAMGFEGGVTLPTLNETADSNLHYNLLNLAIPEVCDSDDQYVSPPNHQPIAMLQNSAVVNTNTGAAPICNDGDLYNSSLWVAIGPRNDIIMQNHPLNAVDTRRSVFTFDGDYLIPSGVLGGLVGQSAATYWRGQGATAWTANTNYAPGALVSDQQAGAWGGKTTYWRCISTTNCNSGTTSPNVTRPSTGVDPSNLYLDFNAYWEPAYMQFFRQQVFAGTVFYEGAVPQLTDINGNPEPMHMIGLLNAWLRQGHITMEPNLWRGCLNHASASSECGQQIPMIQHIPMPSATL